jgi:hypothetical protein
MATNHHATTLQDLGCRFVCRDGSFTWRHPLELQSGDVDCTDMDDEHFERFVIALAQAFAK